MLSRIALLLAMVTALHGAPEYPKMGPDIYDIKADGNQLIDTALAKAKADHHRVLLMFGANWCIWCHRLEATFRNNPEVARDLRDHYELVLIDVNRRHGINRNADVDERYRHPTRLGLPVLVVLDASGKQLTTKDSGDLENGKDGHDPAKIIAFLDQWKPHT